MEKAKVFKAFCDYKFTHKFYHLQSQGKVYNQEDLLLIEEEQVREHINKLDIYKTMRLNGVYPCFASCP